MRDDSVSTARPNPQAAAPTRTMTAGAALLTRLKTLGVDAIFANSGTDFPPIIEGLAEAAANGLDLPLTLVMPHESAAMGMAHGYWLASGRAQAVMVHTNVGLANAAIGAINAATEGVPVLLIGGRTPTLEQGRFGARTVPIGWGQEMRDQTALVREACKWDYELRFPEQVAELADRAHAIAESLPRGPVYLNLPREVLCESVTLPDRRPQMHASVPVPAQSDIDAAADILAAARQPVIFAQRGAGSDLAMGALCELAEDWGIPVCQYWATQLAMPTTHPMAAGPDPRPLLARADAVLVLDALAPWAPGQGGPRDEAQVIQIGPDPLHARTPVRNFRADLALAGEVGPAILRLKAAMDARLTGHRDRNRARAARVADWNAVDRAKRQRQAEQGRAGPMSKAWVSQALSQAIQGSGAAVFSELGVMLPHMDIDHSRGWYDGPLSGGLGWAFPAALGFKLADPARPVIATMGDGSYIFANPTACHLIAQAHGLSIVVMVLNNAGWGAVKSSVTAMYPQGHAARSGAIPLTDLSPSPDFVRVAQASHAWARRVDSAGALDTALADALAHTAANKGLALIEVTISRD